MYNGTSEAPFATATSQNSTPAAHSRDILTVWVSWHGHDQFVMRALEVQYEAPAVFDDLLEIFVRTSRIGRSSLTNECAAYRVSDDMLMCTARLTVESYERALCTSD